MFYGEVAKIQTGYEPQRALAALTAMSTRLSGASVAERALPALLARKLASVFPDFVRGGS